MGQKFDELINLIEIGLKEKDLESESFFKLSDKDIRLLAETAAEIAGKFYFSEYVNQENEITRLKKELDKKEKDDQQNNEKSNDNSL